MTKRILLLALTFISLVRPGCDLVTLPLDWTTATGISRANLNLNPIALRDGHNDCADSLNTVLAAFTGWSGALTLASTQDLILKVDSDANGTHKLVVTGNSLDTMFRVHESGVARFFNRLTVDSAVLAHKATITDSLILTAATASRLLATGAGKQAVSVSDLTSWIAGTANQITSTSDGDGTLTLSLPSAVTFPGSAAVTTTLAANGNVTVGADAGSGNSLLLNGAAGTSRFIQYTTAGGPRWALGVQNVAESGSNAGAPLVFEAYADDGETKIDDAISITRAAGGTMAIARPVSMSSTLGVAGDQENASIVRVTRASESNAAFASRVTGDADNRFRTTASGKIDWGSGAAASDVSLERGAASTLLLTGNLSLTGLQTALGGIAIAGGSTGAGRLFQSATDGLVIRALTGSGNDLALYSQDQGTLLANPTGTRDLNVGNGSGVTYFPGQVTFQGNTAFNSTSANQFLLTNGSNFVTSVGATGSGDVVRATSPTLTTPNIGAATGTSLNLSGNLTADSIVSAKFYAEGSATFYLLEGAGADTIATGTLSWVRVGKQVTVQFPALTGTSGAVDLTLEGFPAAIMPPGDRTWPFIVINNGAYVSGLFTIYNSGTRFDFGAPSLIGFTSSGDKGIEPCSITYNLQ